MQQAITTLTPNPAIDVSTAVDALDDAVKLRCSTPSIHPGGGGINAAEAIVALGGAATAIYTAGGPHGGVLDELLRRRGLAIARVPIAEDTRENIIVAERETGATYRFVMPGPELVEDEWRVLLDEVERDDSPWIVASGSVPPGAPEDLYARVLQIAQRRGARVLLDGPAAALRPALSRGGVFLLKPNWREFAELTGARTLQDQQRCATDIVARGQAEVVIVTLGVEGALVVTSQNQFLTPAHPVERPASATGAGDSFMGALVLALARGWALDDAACFGAAAAGAAMLTPGTQPCRRADVERLYQGSRPRALGSIPAAAGL